MEDSALSQNLDVGSYQDMGIVGRTEEFRIYPKAPLIRATALSTRDVELDFLKLRLEEPRFPTELSKHQKIATSAVTSLDYPERCSVRPRFEISRDTEDFINTQKKSVRFRRDILSISEKASEFLRKHRIEAKISIPLFTDPEYGDWVEPEIRIEVPRNELKRAYDVYNDLLSYSLKGVRKKTLRKIFVTIENR